MVKMIKRIALVLCLMALCVSTLAVGVMAQTEPVTAQVDVQVKLSGTQPEQAQAFAVELRADEAGNPMPEGAKDGVYTMQIQGASTGKLAFSFDRLGVYHYTVTQLPGTNADCYQDASVYHITATVVNNADYTGFDLMMAIRRNDETEKRASIVFENRYANPTTVQLKATKTMDGKTPKDGAFSFQLKDAAGKVVQTVTNQGGAVTFDQILCAEVGEKTYTIVEVPGKDEEIIYDNTVYTAKVKVSKDEEGNYQAAVSYLLKDEELKDAPAFKNKTKPTTPQTGDSFPIFLVTAVMVVSLAAIVILMMARKRKAAK